MSATLVATRPKQSESFAPVANLWQTKMMEQWDRLDSAAEQESVAKREHYQNAVEQVTTDSEMSELFILVQRGDQAAFSRFYDALAPRVFGLILRVIADHAQSEEVTQEVFLHAWQQAGTFEPSRGSVRSWLLTIAHRRAVDRVRSSQSSGERDRKIGARDIEVAFDVVVEGVQQLDARERVVAALNTLTPVQRECVVMAYYDGCSQREIAKTLGVPIGTVKTRIRDGVIRLREILGVNYEGI